jgi:hypothetical protein
MLTVVHISLEDPVIHNNAQTGYSVIVLRVPHVLGWLKGKTYLTPAFSWPLNFCVFHEIYLNLDPSKHTELSAMTHSTAASMLSSRMAKTLIALSCIKKKFDSCSDLPLCVSEPYCCDPKKITEDL